MNTSTTTSVAAGSSRRLPGPDVIRGFALIGVVVMNYQGYLILRGGRRGTGWLGDLLDPWRGPLATRFAATFVLVAGVGVTLLTRGARASGDADRVTEMRWRLVRRGALLYVVGLLLEEIWPGTIIPFYGAMFVIAAAMFTLRGRWIALIGTLAVVAGAAVRVWVFWRRESGESVAWLTNPEPGTVQYFVFNVFVNGTHPLLPWFGFLCVGMLLGRVLDQATWRATAFGAGLMLYALAALLAGGSTPFQTQVVRSTHPDSRGLVYMASALGTALLAYAVIDWLATRFDRPVDPLRRAGQLTLTLYIAHILVFNFVVDWMGWVEPAGQASALLFALVFWVVGIAAAMAWQRHLGRGPAERIYRAIGG